MSLELKTSDEWARSKEFDGLIILDPDGWDRQGDYDYSFYREKITRKEFESRMVRSTIMWSLPKI